MWLSYLKTTSEIPLSWAPAYRITSLLWLLNSVCGGIQDLPCLETFKTVLESRELYLEMFYWPFPSMHRVRCGLYTVAKWDLLFSVLLRLGQSWFGFFPGWSAMCFLNDFVGSLLRLWRPREMFTLCFLFKWAASWVRRGLRCGTYQENGKLSFFNFYMSCLGLQLQDDTSWVSDDCTDLAAQIKTVCS